MTLTILRMGWLMLRRDKVAMLLSFILPIVFFTIFVFIFGSMQGGGSTDPVSCIVVDLDKSDASRRFIAALQNDPGLDIRLAPAAHPDQPYTREAAWDLVKAGRVRVAAILPHGFGDNVVSFSGDGHPVELLADTVTDPVAHQMVAGLMQRAVMTGAPDLMIEQGLAQFDKWGGGLTPQQRALMDQYLPMLRTQTDPARAATQPAAASTGESSDASAAAFSGPVNVKVVSVLTEHKSEWAAFVAFQASATAVMFLLFTVAGAGGSLLEEQETGVLDRLLTANVGMMRLILGKWLFIALLGFVQVALMFLWGAALFGLDLFTPHHLAGFTIMTLATSMAAASLGLLLASICKSRAQLGGLSTVVILTMSAVGGSMFPRFLMSQELQLAGKFCTFNAWALDGYRKVFFANAPLPQLWPEVAVLALITAAFLVLARLFARRWEAT